MTKNYERYIRDEFDKTDWTNIPVVWVWKLLIAMIDTSFYFSILGLNNKSQLVKPV